MGAIIPVSRVVKLWIMDLLMGPYFQRELNTKVLLQSIFNQTVTQRHKQLQRDKQKYTKRKDKNNLKEN